MSKFESSLVTTEFKKQKQAHLSDPSAVVIVGVSGGPDSMAMLYLLHRFDVKTVVVHCNYQLRGEASDKDQKLVEDICLHWKMECVSIRFDSKQEVQGNFQDWARKRRYQVFEDLQKEYRAGFILTAHHQDDQLETILQKILRGAGFSSWKGMNALEGNLLRPLLNLSKSDIMDFVEEFNIPYRIDGSNEESTYARNFIRNHWFPDLNRLFPGWKSNLQKVTERAEEFQAMSDWILNQISEGKNLAREKFLELPLSVQKTILLEFIKQHGVDAEVSSGFLQTVEELSGLTSGSKLQISEDVYLMRDRSVFKIIESFDESDVANREITKDQLQESQQVEKWVFSVEPAPKKFSEDSLHLDLASLLFPLTIRRWKEGDVFQPFGMDGTQLISDHLTNRKIPSSQKKQALVVASFDTTICALIFPDYNHSEQLGTISDNVRCTSLTDKTLTIRKIK